MPEIQSSVCLTGNTCAPQAEIRAQQAKEQAKKRCPACAIAYSATPCGAIDATAGDTRQHGIVTFHSLRAATIARQVRRFEKRSGIRGVSSQSWVDRILAHDS
jgi:hypothetical protein